MLLKNAIKAYEIWAEEETSKNSSNSNTIDTEIQQENVSE
jgi:hypothetical protein